MHVDPSTLHPEQTHIFKLWQIYLENVDPLFKVTHSPTLQTRIIDATANLGEVSPALEALMFSIYCVAVQSISSEECATVFGEDAKEMLAAFQLATP